MADIKRIQIIYRQIRDGIPVDRIVMDREMTPREVTFLENALLSGDSFDMTITIRLTAERLLFIRAICAFISTLIKAALLPRDAIKEVVVDTYKASINVNSCYVNVPGIKELGYTVYTDDKDRSIWIEISVDDLKNGGYLTGG